MLIFNVVVVKIRIIIYYKVMFGKFYIIGCIILKKFSIFLVNFIDINIFLVMKY